MTQKQYWEIQLIPKKIENVCEPSNDCSTEFDIPDELTPACGIDGDGDGDKCDAFETFLTCPKDCQKLNYCSEYSNGILTVCSESGKVDYGNGAGCEVYGDANGNGKFGNEDPLCIQKYLGDGSCLNNPNMHLADLNCDGEITYVDPLLGSQLKAKLAPDENKNGVYDPCEIPIIADCKTDTDKDGLSDEYEDYLNQQTPQKIKNEQSYSKWFDKNKADSDGDGINDNQDFCPNTDTKNNKLTVKKGKINVMGCFVTDVGRGNAKNVRPDGCFTAFDTTYYGQYYKKLSKYGGSEKCLDLYGEEILK